MPLNLILLCWDILGVFWLATMFSTKRTVYRQTGKSRSSYWVLFVLSFWLLFGRVYGRSHPVLAPLVLPHSVFLDFSGVILTIGGLAFALWARVTLGGNWSGAVTFKEDHELVVSGPYAWVRHPIYTGILLMFLGTVMVKGSAGPIVGWVVLLLSFRIKYRQEEALMIEKFGNAYLDYRRRVGALVPFAGSLTT